MEGALLQLVGVPLFIFLAGYEPHRLGISSVYGHHSMMPTAKYLPREHAYEKT